MNNHPLIGCYVPRNEPLPVYYDPDSQEIYYLDEQGGAYLLTGLDLDIANPIDLTPKIMAKTIPGHQQGIIHGGSYYWVLSKTYMQAGKYSRDHDRMFGLWGHIGWAAYTDNVEYKPKKCGDGVLSKTHNRAPKLSQNAWAIWTAAEGWVE